MSCIRFSTPEQLRQLRAGVGSPVMMTSHQAVSAFPVPAVTASKVHRLRVLAGSGDPKIRESVASSLYAPRELYSTLAADADDGVRGCIARNEAVPVDILRNLVHDRSEQVRGWLVVNRSTPRDVVESLSSDPSPMVAGLVEWSRAIG